MIINQDCLEYMATQADNTVDCIITSPPYNIGRSYGSYTDKQEQYFTWMSRVWQEALKICSQLHLEMSAFQCKTPYLYMNSYSDQRTSTEIGAGLAAKAGSGVKITTPVG